MKKIHIIIIAVLGVVLIIGGLLIKNNLKKENINESSSDIVIVRYNHKNMFNKKYYHINDESDINKIGEYVKELRPLRMEEMVGLEINREVEIRYYDYITIEISLSESHYCNYINTRENISSLSKMPKGLFEWVKEKVK